MGREEAEVALQREARMGPATSLAHSLSLASPPLHSLLILTRAAGLGLYLDSIRLGNHLTALAGQRAGPRWGGGREPVLTGRAGTLGPARPGRALGLRVSPHWHLTRHGPGYKARCRASGLAKPNLNYRRRHGH